MDEDFNGQKEQRTTMETVALVQIRDMASHYGIGRFKILAG